MSADDSSEDADASMDICLKKSVTDMLGFNSLKAAPALLNQERGCLCRAVTLRAFPRV